MSTVLWLCQNLLELRTKKESIIYPFRLAAAIYKVLYTIYSSRARVSVAHEDIPTRMRIWMNNKDPTQCLAGAENEKHAHFALDKAQPHSQ